MQFYTFVQQYGNSLLVRGFKNGSRYTEKTSLKPSLFIKSKNNQPTEYKSLFGGFLSKVDFDDINDAKDFIKRYQGVEGFEIHGMREFAYQYISDKYPEDIKYDPDKIKVVFIDIEVDAVEGFPNIETASDPISVITLHDRSTNKSVCFGYKQLPNVDKKDYIYKNYKDEISMIRGFIEFWSSDYPDIVSGWNSDQFDFPYIINRIARVLDEDMMYKLSPFNRVNEKRIEIRGREVLTYNILGVVQLDYLDLYKKFTYSQLESYKLDFVAKEELDESKHEAPCDSFHQWYTDFYESYVDYNVHDARLVHELDNKLNMINLACDVAFLAKVNLRDMLGPVKTWDIFIYNHLKKKNVVIPPQKQKIDGVFEGAWVKDPKYGMQGWTVSIDFESLYPKCIMQWNMSPETILPYKLDVNVKSIVAGDRSAISECITKNATVAANGTMYRKDKHGVVPEVIKFTLDERKIAKKKMLELKKQYEISKDKSLEFEIASLDNRQQALKILANSLYGALSNVGFRYYDLRIAEAITLTGQASDQNLERHLNMFLNKSLKTSNIDYVLYGDTDSLYLNLQPIVDLACEDKSTDAVTKFLDRFAQKVLQPVIDQSLNEVFDICNCYEKLMNAKREAIASRAFWTAKKRYAMMVHNSEGVDYKPYKLKIMGMDIIKSSTPKVVRDLLRECLLVIFEKDEQALQEFYKSKQSLFNSLSSNEIGIPRGVSDITKWVDTGAKGYKSGTPIHVRGSILYNTLNKGNEIFDGDKIKYIFLKLPNPIKENVIAFPADGVIPDVLKDYIDYEMQWEKTFIAPLKGITDSLSWNLEKRSDLFSFF